MPTITLDNGRLRAAVLPELGAGLAGLWHRRRDGRWMPVLRPAPEGVRWFNDLACYLLAPWPNRIAGGCFSWEGADVRLPADWADGTAIHGLVKEARWEVERAEGGGVVLRMEAGPGAWPWPFDCVACYTLIGGTFRGSLRLRHVGREGWMPCGIGFHPFLVRPEAGDEVWVRAPVQGRYPLRGVMPIGPPVDDALSRSLRRGTGLGKAVLDEVFAGSVDGTEIRWPGGLGAVLRCSPALGHTVLYSAGAMDGRRAASFCLEPVSMVNNGFNLAAQGWSGTGVTTLGPGEWLEGWWSLELFEGGEA